MPYAGPRVILQLIDFDDGDDNWSSTYWEQLDAVNNRFISFEFSDHAEEIDELKAAFRNDDFRLIDTAAFVVGQKFLVSWGWPGNMSPPRRMIVAKRQNGNPFIVYMRDPVVLLHNEKKSRHMSNVTDSEFVRRVAEEYGYVGTLAHIEKTKTRRDITQPKKRTDAQQLRHLARRNGFEFYIDENGLHWQSRDLSQEIAHVYSYRRDKDKGSIISEPVIDQKTDKTPSKVIVEGRDPTTKETFKIEVTASTSTEPSLGNEIEIGDPEQSTGKRAKRAERINVYPAGYLTFEEAQLLASAIYSEQVRGSYQLRFSIIGDPQVRAKQLVWMHDLSAALDGTYFLREVIHSISPGSYTIELIGERDALTEVQASRKAQRGVKSNKKAPPEEVEIYGPIRVAEVRLGPDGEPVPTYVYVESEKDPYYKLMSSAEDTTEERALFYNNRAWTQEELSQLDERSLRTLAEMGARSQLPDI